MKNNLNENTKTLDDKALLSDEDLEIAAGGSASNSVFANQHNENTIDSANALGVNIEDANKHSRSFSMR